MMTALSSSLRSSLVSVALISACTLTASAQRPSRIVAPADNAARATLNGSRPSVARSDNDAGIMPQSTVLHGISINFNRSAAQQAALEALLVAQQDSSSPQYHQWLTPDQFAAQFGMSDSDLAAVQNWLTGQGFTVTSVSRGLNRIEFTGTEAQIEAAFETQLHYFTAGSEKHYAPASDLTVPAAFSSVIQSVGNLSDFRPHSHLRQGPLGGVKPEFNSGQTGSHFLTPKDLATIYDINAAYNAGYTGKGQSIAIVGQSDVILSDIAAFRSAAGVTAAAPIPVLYPGTGTATIYTGDEDESDLDLEYSSAIAPGATVYFVYVGSSTNYGVYDSVQYAITNRIAPVISLSYGSCEAALGSTPTASLASFNAYNAIFQQATAQGQTIVASSGDDGSTNCYGFTSLTTAVRSGLAIGFPADSPYVTALGGTEFLSTAVASTNTTYWSASTGADVVSSALSYIPEQAWNDDSTNGLGAGGGGVSLYAARPAWQNSSVPGIGAISGNFRLVPDVSLSSSPNNAGYLYCSSDTGDTGVEGSCNNGFRDAGNKYLTVAGGTSFAAPIFAGMVAIINQAVNSTGQGNINPTLYALASNPTTYASAFHDITTGSNGCTASPASLSCTASGSTNYTATTGYDEATGLGSVDLNNLLNSFKALAGASKTASTTVVSAATTVPKAGVTDTVTITVLSGSTTSTTTPTGTITLLVNGVAQTGTLTLVNGVATYSFSSATAGQDVIVANYSGDANYAPSTSTLLLQVGGAGTFNIAASNTTVSDGSTATVTVAVSSVNGYAGSVALSLTTSPAITNACYTVTNATVPAGGSGTATITVYTNETQCSLTTTTLAKSGGVRLFRSAGPVASAHTPANPAGRGSSNPWSLGVSFAGLLAVGFLGRRSRALRSLVAIALVSVAAFGMSACGSTASAPVNTIPTTYATTGSYTIIVQGSDTLTATNTNYANFTLTIQ